jgi:hypothetical protein
VAPRKNRPILYEVAGRKPAPKPARWTLWDQLGGKRDTPADGEENPPTPAAEAPEANAAAAPAARVHAPTAAPAPAPAQPREPAPEAQPAPRVHSAPPAPAPRLTPAPAPSAIASSAAGEAPLDEDIPDEDLPPPRRGRPSPPGGGSARGPTIPPAVALRGEASRPPGAVSGGRALDNSQLLTLGAVLVGLLIVAWLLGPLFRPAATTQPVAATAGGTGEEEVDAGKLFSQITSPESLRRDPALSLAPPTQLPRPPAPQPAGPNGSREATAPPPAVGEKPPTGEPAGPTIELRRGFHYIVVQHFPTRKADDARAAAQFLIDRGLPCALYPGSDIRLLLTEPFLMDQDDAAQAKSETRRADKLLTKVRELGVEFRKSGGGYDFAGATIRKMR